MNEGLSIDVNRQDMEELKALRKKLNRNFRGFLEGVAKTAVRYARALLGNDYTGALEQSLTYRVTDDRGRVEAWVGTDIGSGARAHGFYAYFQEHGFARHFVSFARAPELALWARRHGHQVDDRGGIWVGKRKSKEGYFLGPGVKAAWVAGSGQLDEVVDKL